MRPFVGPEEKLLALECSEEIRRECRSGDGLIGREETVAAVEERSEAAETALGVDVDAEKEVEGEFDGRRAFVGAVVGSDGGARVDDEVVERD